MSDYFLEQILCQGEQPISNSLQNISQEQAPPSRGRKKLRPGNPVKTEVLDKYWLRSFKAFVKSEKKALIPYMKDSEFWNWYILKGKPGQNCTFLTYNSKYRKELFDNPEYCAIFINWGFTFGGFKLPMKVRKDSWVFYYEYLHQDLIPRAFLNTNIESVQKLCSFFYKLTIKKNLGGIGEVEVPPPNVLHGN